MLGRQAKTIPTLVSTTFQMASGIRLPGSVWVRTVLSQSRMKGLTGVVPLSVSLDYCHHTEGRNNGDTIRVSNSHRSIGRRAYKPPSRKIPDIAIFCDRDMTSFQIQGTGRTRSIKSVATLGIATPRK